MNEQAYSRVEDARFLLESFGLDQERSNERSAYVLLALLHLSPETPKRPVQNHRGCGLNWSPLVPKGGVEPPCP